VLSKGGGQKEMLGDRPHKYLENKGIKGVKHYHNNALFSGGHC